jgi:hypothetical protein
LGALPRYLCTETPALPLPSHTSHRVRTVPRVMPKQVHGVRPQPPPSRRPTPNPCTTSSLLGPDPPRAAFDPASPLFGQPLVLWKSDHQSACLNLPGHPGWQIRPIVSVDGRLRIVRRLVFGSRAFPRIWVTDRCGPYRVDLHLRDGRRFDPISTVCGNTLASATPNS